MGIQWDGRIGMAAVLGVIGPIVTTVTVIWVASGVYTKIIDKIDAQGSKIEEVAKGSDTRFQSVYSAFSNTRDAQQQADQRLSRVETAISYISSQVQRVEAKLDGGPPAPALPPPKQ